MNLRAAMFLAGLVVAGMLAWGAFALVPELSDLLPRTEDQDAVAAVAERTVIAIQTVAIPPRRDPDGSVPPGVIAAMRAEVRETAAELFAASYREAWIAKTDDIVDVETSGEFIFEGGAYDFTRWRIDIAGDRATVAVRCRIFLVMAQTFDTPRHRAENTVDYELALERADGTWLVTGLSLRFAPGGGP